MLFCSKNKCSQGSLFSTPPEHLFSGQYGTNLVPCGSIFEPNVAFPAHLRAENRLFCSKNKCSEGSLFSTPSVHLFSSQNGANLEPCGPILEPTGAESGLCQALGAMPPMSLQQSGTRFSGEIELHRFDSFLLCLDMSFSYF